MIDHLTADRRQIAGEMRALMGAPGHVLSQSETDRLEELDHRFDRVASEEAKLRHAYRAVAPGNGTYQRIHGAISADRDEGSHAADPIREMIEGHETYRDFAPATSAQTRSLPDLDWGAPQGTLDNWLPGGQLRVERDELFGSSRAISNFANGAALSVNDFAARVAVYERTLSPWIRLATVIDADNGRPIVVPQMTADVTTYVPGEATAITENSGTLGEATATPIGFKAMTYISYEALEDAQIKPQRHHRPQPCPQHRAAVRWHRFGRGARWRE